MRKILFLIFLFAFAGCGSSSLKNNTSEKTALVIGTIHKEHLKEATYPIQSLKTIMNSYKPDLVLVEIRPEKLKSGELEDGPFEMAYVVAIANQMGIEVAGIDYWTEMQIQKELEQNPNAELDQKFQMEFEKIPKAPESSTLYEYIHSPQKRAEHARIMNLRKLVYSGNPEWNQRQSWFHYNADNALRDGKHNRVLAFVGYEHRLELNDFMGDINFTPEDPLHFSPTPNLKNLEDCVPSEVTQVWAKGSQRLFTQAKSLKEPLKSRIKSKAEYFFSAVKMFENKICK